MSVGLTKKCGVRDCPLPIDGRPLYGIMPTANEVVRVEVHLCEEHARQAIDGKLTPTWWEDRT